MLLSSFGRLRGAAPILIAFLLVISALFFFRGNIGDTYAKIKPEGLPDIPGLSGAEKAPAADAEKPAPSPIYKPAPEANPKIELNFPAGARAEGPKDIPPVPSFNKPKTWVANRDPPAPLMIAMTRNWPMLQQAVVSYLAAGWPASQIYVIDNTGTMNANRLGKLTLQNPFYIDYRRLEKVFGVNVLTAPTLLTFAQLQNYMMYTAIEKGWKTYFWGHMDVIALSDETYHEPDKKDASKGQYYSIFDRALAKRMELEKKAADKEEPVKWALWFFAYDRLALVNLEAYLDVGGWDPQIGYYTSDCEFHWKLSEAGWFVGAGDVGMVADVGHYLPDLGILYRRVGYPKAQADEGDDGKKPLKNFGTEDVRGAEGYQALKQIIEDKQREKGEDPRGRNYWQAQQQGGQGEPFYRDSAGFERALWMTISLGRKIYSEKWGHRDCDLGAVGLKPSDAWRVEKDGDWDLGV